MRYSRSNAPGKTSTVGSEMTTMLKAMKHRGPDSTGFALYQESMPKNKFVMRFKVAEGSEAQSGFDIQEHYARENSKSRH